MIKKKQLKKSTKVAFGGITVALSLILLLLSAVIPGTEYAIPLFAGILLIPISKEIGKSWAFLTYISVTILSLMLVMAIRPEPPIVYASFLGYYPILKEWLDKLKYKWLSYIIRYAIFNASVGFVLWMTPVALELLGMPPDNITFLEKFPIWAIVVIVLIIANIFFIVYDICLNRVTAMYMSRLHPIFSKFIRR